MDLQASFDVLSAVIERYESAGRSIRDVEASAADGELVVELDISVDLCSGGRSAPDPRSATLTDGGGLRVEFDPPGLPDPPPELAGSVAAEVHAVSVAGDRLVQTVGLAITPDGATRTVTADPTGRRDATADRAPAGGAADGTDCAGADERTADGTDCDGRSSADPLAAVRDESVPPYEDVPYLERLYETCDTFVEMSRRIDMDVSSETVRRYMIEAGVHSPTAYSEADESGDGAGTAARTGSDADGAGECVEEGQTDPTATLPDEQLVTDGAGLPADLRVADVVDAVAGATTVYEVHRRLDLDQTRTRALLAELDLLDLVMHRVAHASNQRITEDAVAARLRERATDGN